MLVSAVAFVLLEMLPINFSYAAFASILLLMGLSMGAFASPNRAGVMNSLPAAAPRRRRRHEPDVPELGAGALDRDLLHADDHRPVGDPAAHARSAGLEAHGVARAHGATRSATSRPSPFSSRRSSATTRSQQLLGRARPGAPGSRRRRRGDRRPQLLPAPDRRARSATASHEAFAFAIIACLIAAAASWSRGGRYVHTERGRQQPERGSGERRAPDASPGGPPR